MCNIQLVQWYRFWLHAIVAWFARKSHLLCTLCAVSWAILMLSFAARILLQHLLNVYIVSLITLLPEIGVTCNKPCTNANTGAIPVPTVMVWLTYIYRPTA